ncbi:hypothetical protein AMAG_12782 [Allomyces macrogynus ATCC 38327]|uniref:Uncharacterized protein n=1 Tax=Allomyces macrogynus (strain ATCC 38327) TaxID=578462 RepID=A0A0L0T1H7_ALLM3|nr:hypothetical protein AMAG_12782 [Allomyces macrogynus ATCC 38327]|eukprot:KNE68611.1 hypothetical protein AMAG_12782 [Allomyces macrogynus ATCC 38327]
MSGSQSAAPHASIHAYGMPTPASSVHDDHEHPHTKSPSSRGAGGSRKPLPPLFSPAAAEDHAWAASPADSAAAVLSGYASAPASAGFWGPATAPVTAMPPSRKRVRSPDVPCSTAVHPPPPSQGACKCADCRLPPPHPAPATVVAPAAGARVALGVVEFSTHP